MALNPVVIPVNAYGNNILYVCMISDFLRAVLEDEIDSLHVLEGVSGTDDRDRCLVAVSSLSTIESLPQRT